MSFWRLETQSLKWFDFSKSVWQVEGNFASSDCLVLKASCKSSLNLSL